MKRLAFLVALLWSFAAGAACIPGVGQWTVNSTTVTFQVCGSDGSTWATVGASAWGVITGTLSAQTDLQSALDGKLATNGSAANLTSFPTLNQNTTGSAATLTTGRTINGTSFNGSANITLGAGSVTLAQQADMATSSLIYRKTAGTGVPEVNTLATLKTDLGLTGTNSGDQTITLTGDVTGTGTGSFATAIKASVALTTPNIGAATGTSLAATGAITSSGTAGIGYATGAGCAVTQLTNKATATPACNKMSGEITMNGAALAAATIVSFTLTNNVVGATDVLVLNHVTTGTRGAYTLNGQASAGSAIIYVRNNTAGSLSEAIVIRFVVIKGVTS